LHSGGIYVDNDRLIQTFVDLVKVDSPSKKEKQVAQKLQRMLDEMGFETYFDDAYVHTGSDTGNLIARLRGSKSVQPILLGAHMDTVMPGKNIKPQIENGVIKSDGTTILGADDKAGITAIIEGIRYIKENNIPHGDIEVIFTTCEEVGLLGAKHLEISRLNSKYAFILDSSGQVGTVITKGPAEKKIYTKIIGKAAHAGLNPEKGISAIQVAAEAINNMKLLRIDEETTANIGIIKGGTATNIVCDLVEIVSEARSLNREKLTRQVDHMVTCFKKACDNFSAKLEIHIEESYPEFAIDENDAILEIVKKAMKRSGLKCSLKSTGGGSDTNILNRSGIKAVTLGIGMTNCHSTDEYITLESLEKATDLVINLIQEVQ